MARLHGKDRGIVEKPRGSDKWWVRLYVDGREVWKRCTDKTQARKVYIRLKEEARQGTLLPRAVKKPAVPRLRDYVPHALKALELRGTKPATIEAYSQRLNKHILPSFGAVPINEITRPLVKDWVGSLLDSGLDYDTVAKGYYCTLSSLLSEAVEDGHLSINPLFRKKKILSRPQTLNEEDEIVYFTIEEQQALLQTFQEHRSRFYPMALLLFRTGLRIGEMLALHRADIDLRDRTLRVRRNFSHGRLGTPKSGKSRKVDLSQALVNTLKAWVEVQDLEAAAAGTQPPTVLFPGNLGGTRQVPSYMAENYFRAKVWFPCTEKAEVRRLGPHAARHTFASLLIHHGESLKYVSAQMGHSSIQITCDTYGHLLSEGDRSAVDRLDAIGSRIGSEQLVGR